MTVFWLRLWRWSRRKAIAAIREEFPGEYQDARKAWSRAALSEELRSPAWDTRGLGDDLALHDAAGSLLEEDDHAA